MSVFKIFDVAGSAMNAQMLRLNTVSSNMANAETIATKPEDVYKARHPVFETVMNEFSGDGSTASVKVSEIVESETPAIPHYMPGHPMANKEGYVFGPAINSIEEMTDMISASRSYQNNVEVLTTAKQLLIRTLSLGRT